VHFFFYIPGPKSVKQTLSGYGMCLWHLSLEHSAARLNGW